MAAATGPWMILAIVALSVTACREARLEGAGTDVPVAEIPTRPTEASAPPGPQPSPAVTADAMATPLPHLHGRVIRIACRQGECAWLRVVRLETVLRTPRGELRRLVRQRAFSEHPGGAPRPESYSDELAVRWATEQADYAFCSTSRPSYAFTNTSGVLIAHPLDLYNVAGFQWDSAVLYMRLCHDRAYDPEAHTTFAALGYREGTRARQFEIFSPEELARR